MTAPLQPLLHDEHVVFRAPTQAWSATDGSIGSAPIHGLYDADTRVLRELALTLDGHTPEHLAIEPRSADTTVFVALARTLDDPSPDPGVRLERRRTVRPHVVTEEIVLRSRRSAPVATTVVLAFRADEDPMDAIKSGLGGASTAPLVTLDGSTARWRSAGLDVALESDGDVRHDRIVWSVTVPADGEVRLSWTLHASDPSAVVDGAEGPPPWTRPAVRSADGRLQRWLDRALDDLDALRMTTTAAPGEFLAAGAPWFFTLFGRDSIWAARMLLPLGTALAADTLRVLAALQGTADDAATAQEPGKIMHELRRDGIQQPADGLHLPPLYYGTVDATPLWVCLLHDAWRWGMPEDEVRDLLPHLERALAWMRDSGDSDGDGLLEYVDRAGTGLSNQGWKDSGDSVQWRDGRLADGPIALCEVQAYAYEAARNGAAVLDAFGGDGAPWRAWAERLRARFHASYWLEDAAGPYLAIALDAAKRPVDTVTSNLGHVLGTGILDAEQSRAIAARLVSPDLDSGFGVRTMSTQSDGYWPLSYHGGSVWTHDTAIAVSGLARDGHLEEADRLAHGLLSAAEGFDYRMPELHSGDARDAYPRPVPYPAACRPQAWSAAASVSVLASALGLQPGGQGLVAAPGSRLAPLTVDGVIYRGGVYRVTVDAAGARTERT